MSQLSILRGSQPCAKQIETSSEGLVSLTPTTIGAFFDHSYEAVGSFAELADFLEEFQNNPYGFIVRGDLTSESNNQQIRRRLRAKDGIEPTFKFLKHVFSNLLAHNLHPELAHLNRTVTAKTRVRISPQI